MAYVLTDGGSNVVVYPYNIGLLRRDNPNVSFPANPTSAQLSDWNVFPVVATPQPPVHLIDENLVELDPVLVSSGGSGNQGQGQGGQPGTMQWEQRWSVVPASPQEIADRTAAYEEQSNLEALRLLKESDTYISNAYEQALGLHPDFVAYRDELKFPSQLTGYPAYTAWPAFPSNIYGSPIDFGDDFDAGIINGSTPGAPVDGDFVATFEAAL